MIIEELKKYLRATIIANPDMMKREYALELLEKIIAMEIKLEQQQKRDSEIASSLIDSWKKIEPQYGAAEIGSTIKSNGGVVFSDRINQFNSGQSTDLSTEVAASLGQ